MHSFKKLFNSESNVRVEKMTDSNLLGSVRLWIAFLSMLGTAIMYITRVNLNIAILAMVKYQPPTQSSIQADPYEIKSDDCLLYNLPFQNSTGISTDQQEEMISSHIVSGEFDWSPPVQGIILGSFFYGYISTQIIGGRLAESYSSPTKLIFIALSVSGLINLLTPIFARTSIVVFVISRVVLGAVQGIIYPAFYCLFSKWIPPNERSTFIPWLDAGITIGTILISASSGKIIVWFSKIGGWPVVFYFSGFLALLWSLLWALLVRSDPAEHPFVKQDELSLILDSQEIERRLPSVNPSWKHILTSKVFYGSLAAKITYGIVFDFITLKVPAFFQDVIYLPVDVNGIAFSCIMAGYMTTLLSCGFVADSIITHTSYGKCYVRKLFQLISGTIMGVSLLLMPYVGCNIWGNITVLTISMLGYGFSSGGDLPLTADISGPISGSVFALMNTLSSISGFLVPYIVGVVIESAPNSVLLWSYLFVSCAWLVMLGTLLFVFFVSSDLQTNWCKPSLISSNINTSTVILNFDGTSSISSSIKQIPSRYNTFAT